MDEVIGYVLVPARPPGKCPYCGRDSERTVYGWRGCFHLAGLDGRYLRFERRRPADRATIRKQAADAGVSGTGHYIEWLEDRLLESGGK